MQNPRSEQNTLIEENEHLTHSVYNLTLYINYIETHHPDVFEEIREHFSGLPGYGIIDCNKEEQ